VFFDPSAAIRALSSASFLWISAFCSAVGGKTFAPWSCAAMTAAASTHSRTVFFKTDIFGLLGNAGNST
jgi:hypothetical protein